MSNWLFDISKDGYSTSGQPVPVSNPCYSKKIFLTFKWTCQYSSLCPLLLWLGTTVCWQESSSVLFTCWCAACVNIWVLQIGTQLCAFLRMVQLCCPVGTSLFLCTNWGGPSAALACWWGSLSCLLCLHPLLDNLVYHIFTWFWLTNLLAKILLSHLINWIPSLLSLNPEKGSHGSKRWNPVFNIRYMTSCWPTGFMHSSSSPFSHWWNQGENHQGTSSATRAVNLFYIFIKLKNKIKFINYFQVSFTSWFQLQGSSEEIP